MQLFVASKYCLIQSNEKIVILINSSYTQGSLENIECGIYQLVFVTDWAGFVEDISFLVEKNSLTTVPWVFNLTLWLVARSFPEMQWHKTNQGCFAFQQPHQVGIFLPFPLPPTPLSTLTPNQTWPVIWTMPSL